MNFKGQFQVPVAVNFDSISMHIRFEHARFELGKSGHLWAYRCCTCRQIITDFPASQDQKTDPMKLMYPDKHTMKALEVHDKTHEPKTLPRGAATIEGKL